MSILDDEEAKCAYCGASYSLTPEGYYECPKCRVNGVPEQDEDAVREAQRENKKTLVDPEDWEHRN